MFICTLHTAEATFMANFVVFSTTSVVLSLLSGSHTGSAPDWCGTARSAMEMQRYNTE